MFASVRRRGVIDGASIARPGASRVRSPNGVLSSPRRASATRCSPAAAVDQRRQHRHPTVAQSSASAQVIAGQVATAGGASVPTAGRSARSPWPGRGRSRRQHGRGRRPRSAAPSTAWTTPVASAENQRDRPAAARPGRSTTARLGPAGLGDVGQHPAVEHEGVRLRRAARRAGRARSSSRSPCTQARAGRPPCRATARAEPLEAVAAARARGTPPARPTSSTSPCGRRSGAGRGRPGRRSAGNGVVEVGPCRGPTRRDRSRTGDDAVLVDDAVVGLDGVGVGVAGSGRALGPSATSATGVAGRSADGHASQRGRATAHAAVHLVGLRRAASRPARVSAASYVRQNASEGRHGDRASGTSRPGDGRVPRRQLLVRVVEHEPVHGGEQQRPAGPWPGSAPASTSSHSQRLVGDRRREAGCRGGTPGSSANEPEERRHLLGATARQPTSRQLAASGR